MYKYETNKTIENTTIKKNLYVGGKIFHHWMHDLKRYEKKAREREMKKQCWLRDDEKRLKKLFSRLRWNGYGWWIFI